MRTETILELVADERKRQNEKWGYPQHNTLPEWGIILEEEAGEVTKEINELHFRRNNDLDLLLSELIQLAAVAVSMVEHLTDFPVDTKEPFNPTRIGVRRKL